MAKARLFAKLSNETSLQSCVRELQRIKFVSPFGLIDADAWDDYIKKIQEALSFQSRNGFTVPDSVVKDVIISALPDHKFQTDLVLVFGPIGSMYGHQELSDLIETILARIQSTVKRPRSSRRRLPLRRRRRFQLGTLASHLEIPQISQSRGFSCVASNGNLQT